jgi:hypothetical protein
MQNDIVFGNGSSMKLGPMLPVIFPIKKNTHVKHDECKDRLEQELTSTCLLQDLLRYIIDYYLDEPPSYASFPVAEANRNAVKFSIMSHLWHLQEIEDVTFISDDYIGRIGFQYHSGCDEQSDIFMIVYVHPSHVIFGVIYFESAIFSEATQTVNVTNAHYPVILMTTRSLSTMRSPPSICLVTRESKREEQVHFQLVDRMMDEGEILGCGSAPPYCHITHTMFKTLDKSWWNHGDIGDCTLDGDIVVAIHHMSKHDCYVHSHSYYIR